MRFPTINDHPLRKVRVPQLNGGVNKTDHPSYINDNQLTDCNNMWFAGGRLRTRPGIEKKTIVNKSGCLQLFTKGNYLQWLRTDGLTSIDIVSGEINTSEFRDYYQGVYEPENQGYYDVNLTQAFLAPISKQQQGSGDEEGGTLVIGASSNLGLFMAEHFAPSNTVGENIKPYIPTVKVNVDPTYSDMDAPNGSMYQGYNLLDFSYKISCNTENGCVWKLPTSDREINYIDIEYYDLQHGQQSSRIYVKSYIAEVPGVTNESGTFNFTVKNQTGKLETVTGYFLYNENVNTIRVSTANEDGANDIFASEEPISTHICSARRGGLIIKVVMYGYDSNGDPIDSNYSKITSMTIARWFGGTRGGLENGTRLFVAGGKEEGIIRWSDLNRPNYFSENNYAYVGDGSRITALAQQDNMLVIFQEHAITYATYLQGAEYTAEQIMKEEIVDVSTLSAQFPLTTIHSGIGCDCPDTVRLCNNRLVWLTSEGKVYCLVNNNQYNERNVREISYAIESMLKQHTAVELKAAKSADAGGMYFLFVPYEDEDDKSVEGNPKRKYKIYVLDYANTSFEYYTSNAHEKKMKNYLSWYVWTLPIEADQTHIMGVEGVNDRVCIILDTVDESNLSNSTHGVVLEINLNTLKDYKTEDEIIAGTPTPIPCSFRTKLFAFSGDERMKRIPNCNIGLCKIPGEVDVSFVTDNGSGTPRHITIDEEVSEDNPDAVKRMTLYPNANSTCLFGIEMQSDSAMAVEGISISYKEMRDRQ